MSDDEVSRDDFEHALGILDELHRQIGVLAESFGNTMTASTVGPALTCTEANALAEILESASFTYAADELLYQHAASDEEGDLHYAMTDPHADVRGLDT